MPILAPVSNVKETRVSEQAVEKPVPVAVQSPLSPQKSPLRDSTAFLTDSTPSKLVMNAFAPNDDSSTTPSDDFSDDSAALKIVKTQHKILEESEGFEEPLLKENPHRFVLFPIQDNDVSRCKCALQHCQCSLYSHAL